MNKRFTFVLFWSSVDCAIIWLLDWLINSGTTLWLVLWTINERTNERTNQKMNEWTNERTNEWMDGWIKNEWKYEWMNERTHGRTNERRTIVEWTNEWLRQWTEERQTQKCCCMISSWKKYYQTMVNTLERLFYLRHPSDMMVMLVFQNILYHTYRTTLAFLVSSHSENFSLLLVHLKNRGLFHRDTSSMLWKRDFELNLRLVSKGLMGSQVKD